MKTTKKLQEATVALKKIQHLYNGAGGAHRDLREVKAIAEAALKSIGMWDVSLAEVVRKEKN